MHRLVGRKFGFGSPETQIFFRRRGGGFLRTLDQRSFIDTNIKKWGVSIKSIQIKSNLPSLHKNLDRIIYRDQCEPKNRDT